MTTSPSPVKCSTNFSIARLVGESTNEALTPRSPPIPHHLFGRSELHQHQSPHLMIHPWHNQQHHALSHPYSSVFAHPRMLAWPHQLPGLIPMMHFSSLFQQHHQLGLAGSVGVVPTSTGTLSPPHHKLFWRAQDAVVPHVLFSLVRRKRDKFHVRAAGSFLCVSAPSFHTHSGCC